MASQADNIRLSALPANADGAENGSDDGERAEHIRADSRPAACDRKGIAPGSYVRSLCGRDGGRLFIVLSAGDDGYAYIADGKRHKLCRPKKKKFKHIEPVGGFYSGLDTLTNRKAAAALGKLRAETAGCITDIKRSDCSAEG